MMVPFRMIVRKVMLSMFLRRTLNLCQLTANRLIHLLPMFAKIFEKIIFTLIFEYFIENELFTVCQSGFLPGDSCT